MDTREYKISKSEAVKLTNLFFGKKFSYFELRDDGTFRVIKEGNDFLSCGYAYRYPSFSINGDAYGVFSWRGRIWFAAKNKYYDVTPIKMRAHVVRDGFFHYKFTLSDDGNVMFELRFMDILLPSVDSSGANFFIDVPGFLRSQEVKAFCIERWAKGIKRF